MSSGAMTAAEVAIFEKTTMLSAMSRSSRPSSDAESEARTILARSSLVALRSSLIFWMPFSTFALSYWPATHTMILLVDAGRLSSVFCSRSSSTNPRTCFSYMPLDVRVCSPRAIQVDATRASRQKTAPIWMETTLRAKGRPANQVRISPRAYL